jgi:hypothetical protein
LADVSVCRPHQFPSLKKCLRLLLLLLLVIVCSVEIFFLRETAPPLCASPAPRGRGRKRSLCIACAGNIHRFHFCGAGNTTLSQTGDAKTAGALAPKSVDTNLILGFLQSLIVLFFNRAKVEKNSS